MMENISDQQQAPHQPPEQQAQQAQQAYTPSSDQSTTAYDQPTESNPPVDASYARPPLANWSQAPTDSNGTPYQAPPYENQTQYPGGRYVPIITPPNTPHRRPAGLNGRWPYAIGALLVLVAVFVGGLVAGRASAAPQASPTTSTVGGAGPRVNVPASASELQQTIVTVIHTVQPSVVEVTSQSNQGSGIGSGEILTKDGYIVTNDHVVSGFNSFSVTLSSSQSYPAKLVGQDPQDDLAVLKISTNTNLQPISIGDSSKVQVGEFSIALGTPLGLQQSATFGIVSALNRTASEAPSGPAGTLTGLIQTSAPINPGNSGGALVDLQGQLIGIPTLGAQDPNSGGSANGIGFAIPSDRMQFVTQQLIQNGQLVNSGQGFIGIRGEDVTPQIASAYSLPVQQGVLVAGFANDASGKSPAQAAGLKTGDIIVAVDGQSVTDQNDLGGALLTKSPGTQVTVTVYRGSGKQQIKVTLGERPTNTQG